jgi:prevent-host-death family protein
MQRRTGKVLKSAEFKTNALAVMRRVRDTGQIVTVTSHGRPLVNIVPVPGEKAPTGNGCMRDHGELLASEDNAFPPRKS